MQPIEVALFGAVIALAAGLIGYILWPFARARRKRAGVPQATRSGAASPGRAWCVPPASANTMRACSSVRTTPAS